MLTYSAIYIKNLAGVNPNILGKREMSFRFKFLLKYLKFYVKNYF